MTQLEIKPDAKLDKQLRFERLLAEISTFFINLPADQINSEIESAQGRVCEFLDLDRSSLFQVSEGDPETLLLTHLHQPAGSRIPPERMSLKEFFPWTLQEVLGGKTVTISKMTDLPAEAGRDRETLGLYGTRSVVVVPLSVGRKNVFGLLTFAVVREEREWPETIVQQFKLVAQIFANALARKQTEEALREGKEKLNIVTDAAGAGLWIMELDTSYVWVTPKTRELFHFAPDENLNYESFFKVIHPDDNEKVQQAVQQAIQSEEGLRIEFRIVLPDGSMRWIMARGKPDFGSARGQGRLMGVSLDITERKRAEEASRESERILRQNESDLRGLAGRLINAQEEERSHLARELHDDLAQRLAVFAIDVGQLQLQLMDPPAPVREALRKMKNGIVRISQDVHSLSRQLHPSILDDLGLIKAVESECAGFSRREGIEGVFNHENIPRGIPKDISLSLYRIIQEGLRNISKHACAGNIFVSLKGIDHDVLLSVQDDGIGFDWAEVKRNPGLGFSSMHERARLIHGEFSIKSQPEKGTVITVRAPLTREGE